MISDEFTCWRGSCFSTNCYVITRLVNLSREELANCETAHQRCTTKGRKEYGASSPARLMKRNMFAEFRPAKYDRGGVVVAGASANVASLQRRVLSHHVHKLHRAAV